MVGDHHLLVEKQAHYKSKASLPQCYLCTSDLLNKSSSSFYIQIELRNGGVVF